MVFNATFNNMAVISWLSVLLPYWWRKPEYLKKAPTCRKSQFSPTFIYCIYTWPYTCI